MNYINSLLSLTNRELKKWYKNRILLFISLIQPIIWLILFGKSMNLSLLLSSYGKNGYNILYQYFGTTNYFTYLGLSMLSFVTLFTSIQSGMSLVWDRRLGFLNKLLTTPVPKGIILFSKILNSVIRSLFESLIIFILVIILGASFYNYSIINILLVFSSLILLSIGFSSLFLILSLKSNSWETNMAIINLLGLPLVFASNSFYPIQFIPIYIRFIVYINPLTYANNIVRGLLLNIKTNILFDFIYLISFSLLFFILSVILSWKYLNAE